MYNTYCKIDFLFFVNAGSLEVAPSVLHGAVHTSNVYAVGPPLPCCFRTRKSPTFPMLWIRSIAFSDYLHWISSIEHVFTCIFSAHTPGK